MQLYLYVRACVRATARMQVSHMQVSRMRVSCMHARMEIAVTHLAILDNNIKHAIITRSNVIRYGSKYHIKHAIAFSNTKNKMPATKCNQPIHACSYVYML